MRAAWPVAAYLAAEFGAGMLIRRLRKGFPWLIGPRDRTPEIPARLIARHAATSFDPELGWCRRPGEHGTELTDRGTTRFAVDSRGRRRHPGLGDGPAAVACFGDSYVFCRLVDDDQTWPYQLSQRIGVAVANYGVGNYGLDQALLRLERELPTLEAQVVIMGVVPETIARIHSYWKHYFEYGNVLAFKPRFTVSRQGVLLHPSPIGTPGDYAAYRRHLPAITRLDPFYAAKFRRDVLRFPYLPKLMRRSRRHLPILVHLMAGRRDRAFEVVLRDNARWTARLYADAEACRLLTELVTRFAEVCRDAGKHPVLLVMPQPADLARDGGTAHHALFAELRDVLPVVDVTERFRQQPGGLFTTGRLGPHCGPKGNAVIAAEVRPIVAPLLNRQRKGETHARQGS